MFELLNATFYNTYIIDVDDLYKRHAENLQLHTAIDCTKRIYFVYSSAMKTGIFVWEIPVFTTLTSYKWLMTRFLLY